MKTNLKKWEIIEERDISPSKWFPLYIHKVKLPNGKVVEDYFVSKLGDVAMVVAITKNQEIVLVRQYKHGVREIIYELPAGRIGSHTPEEAAKRELREEVGINMEKLVFLGEVYVAPSKDSTKTFGFLVEGADVTEEQKLDETEEVEIVKIPLAKLDSMIKTGEVKAADTLALISLVKLKHSHLFN